tara:strand:+ start:154 stop:1494 length:1341 start_codon:yes stop_codon:yes gene_type:complete
MEDIDSLRFALSAFNYDVLENQPHFPGYPLFCFVFNLLYHITGSLGFSASIIGGLSIFIIIVFTQKIYHLLIHKDSHFLNLLLFFNPFLWLMSNRYMPDLFGLALLVGGLFFFISSIQDDTKKNLIYLGFFIGCLIGVRLSYVPFFLPVLYLFFHKHVKYFIFSGLFFVLVWFIPWIVVTDVSELIQVAVNDTQGHFFRWGGTIYSQSASFSHRFIKIVESIFADSLGMWWSGRHWITIVNSFFLIVLFCISFFRMYVDTKSLKKEFFIFLLCIFCYFIWVFLFQNIVYKPRHLMPFIPLSCCLLSIGFDYLYHKINFKSIVYMICLCLMPYIIITMKLVSQHKNNSAISQISAYVTNFQGNKIIMSNHLMNYYFNKTIQDDIIYLDNKADPNIIEHYYSNYFRIFTTHRLSSEEYYLVNKLSFYHNPYVNKLWSHLTLYEYEKKE